MATEKDPKQFSGTVPPDNTYTNQRLNEREAPLVGDLLPQVFRTETNKKIFAAMIEDMFQPSAIENVNFSVGRPNSAGGVKQKFLPREESRRQFEFGLLVEDDAGTRMLTADDIALAQNYKDDHLAEAPVPVSVMDLPINPDKFINWNNYYWLDQGMPTLYLAGTSLEDGRIINIEQDILGKQSYTFPEQSNCRELEFKNGMRLVFQKDYPGRSPINGDTSEQHIANGSSQLDFKHEMTQYDKQLITVRVDGIEQVQETDYTFTLGSIIWLNDPPAEGAIVDIDMPDYWVSYETEDIGHRPHLDSKWQVEGVGSLTGIRLIPLTMQMTDTVYSSTVESLWDRTAIPWDRIPWAGDITGVNKKHYVLLSPEAENRAAHSRVNVWIHRDTIKSACEFLGLSYDDFTTDDSVALRPILEFESTLELYEHGYHFRHWVDCVVTKNITDPFELLGTDVTKLLVWTMFGTLENYLDVTVNLTLFEKLINALNTKDFPALELFAESFDENRVLSYETIVNCLAQLQFLEQGKINTVQRRVLWLADGEYKNKIITFKTDETLTVTDIIVETAKDRDATTVMPRGGYLALMEYYWLNGEALPAQTRMTATQEPLFRIYDRDQICLDEWKQQVGFKPTVLNSTIIELVKDSAAELDRESGYKLSFTPTQFKQLPEDHPSANAMYDIQYQYTLQNTSTYLNADSQDKIVPGPYNFRRLKSALTRKEIALSEGLSSGYRRAWFRLRSWVKYTQPLDELNDVDGLVTIDLPVSAWPEYRWAISFRGGLVEAQHWDNRQRTTDNLLFASIGEPVILDTDGIDSVTLYDVINDVEVLSATADDRGLVKFVIPADLPGNVYELRLNGLPNLFLHMIVMDSKIDPRSPTVKLNGMPIEYGFIRVRNIDGNLESLQLLVAKNSGILEVMHQGQFQKESDHCTAIPGLELNPAQDLNLGTLTPARLTVGMTRALRANQLNDTDLWPLCHRLPNLNNCWMADTSDMRRLWAEHRLNPTLSETIVARSMACWRWQRKFASLLDRYNRTYDLANETPRETLDRLLEEMTIGINYSVPDAVSGMALTTNSMNFAEYLGDDVQTEFEINTGGEDLYLGVYGTDHVYVYVNDLLQIYGQYSIVDNKVVFAGPLASGVNLKIYHSPESYVYCGIPATPAKLGLGGLHRPRFVRETWGNYDRLLILRHDGSTIRTYQVHTYATPDPRDAVVLELEKRIYSACLHRVGDVNRQRLVQWVAPDTPISENRAQAELEWFANNDIDFRARADFDENNPWTWNYSGKSWRAIYLKEFGTVQPHAAPWEMLGYDERPSWWSNHYSWIDPVKRSALEQALYDGVISEPGQPVTYDARMRRRHPLGFPITDYGLLLNPFEWGLMAPSVDQARQPWDIGSLGPSEEVWSRSSAGVWSRLLDNLGDQRYSSRVVETGIQPFVTYTVPNCPYAFGEISLAPSNFRQERPTIGIGAVLFETNREINLLGESPIKELALIQVALQFAMGGFTDDNVRFRMYHTRYQSGNYVPEEDFAVAINTSVAADALRYSAVRLEKDDTGFRVYGYDSYQRHFLVATPIKKGPSGSDSGSYQSTFTTSVGDFIEYKKWNLNPTVVEYGHLFADKQELFDFFLGLNEYQTSQGVIFDEIGLRGTVNDWKQAAVDAFVWVEENWNDDHYVVVSPASANEGFKFYHNKGHLDRLDSDLLRRGKILLSNGFLAKSSDLLITRDIEDDSDFIQPLGETQILFADLQLRKYDHVYYFNSYTRFGDLLADNQANIRLDYLDMVGRRSRGWTGRPQSVGLIPQNRGVLPGFDSLVNDLIEARRPEKSQFNVFLGNLSKSNAVPLKNTVLNEVIRDPSVQFAYSQGLQSAAGTNLAISAFFRNREFDIPGRTQDLNINEQWLFRDGEFGYLGNRRVWEIELRRNDMTSNRQVIRFLDKRGARDSRSDNIIDLIGTKDPRWITRSFEDNNFAMVQRADVDSNLTAQQGWLPSAGVANLITTDLKAKDISTLTANSYFDSPRLERLLEIGSFSKFKNYLPGDLAWYQGALYRCQINITGGANTAWDPDQWEVYLNESALNPLPTIWVSDYRFTVDDDDVFGWNIFQLTGPMYVEEACPNALQPGLKESKVTFGSPHRMVEGDIFLLSGSGDGNYDRFHQVLKKVDDYNVLIGQRSTGDVIVYNLVAFKLTTTKFKTLASLQANLDPVAFEGMRAYVEPESNLEGRRYNAPSEGEYIVYQRQLGAWVEDERYTGSGKALVNSHAIEKVLLLDRDTEEVLANLEIYDPYKGLVIDEVGQYIDHRQSADPAVYNIDDLGLADLDANNYWGSEQLNRIWWDTSRVRYIEYEQGNLRYRATNWGRQFADSQVVVYEWIRSETKPDAEVDPYARLDYSSGVGVVRYSIVDEEDPVTGAITTYYYYWQRGVDVLPENSLRKYSALDIELALEDPDASGISWASPIHGPGSNLDPDKQFSALVVSNIGRYLSSRSSVILRVVQKFYPEQNHDNGMLVSEGFTGDVVPEYLYRRLRTSVAGRDHYRKCYEIKAWQPNTAYAKGTYLINWNYSTIDYGNVDYGPRDFPIITHLDGGRSSVVGAIRPVNDLTGDPLVDKLHHVFVVREDGYVSTDDFQYDFLVDERMVLSGTSAFIKDEFIPDSYRAVVIVNRLVPDPRLHPLRRYGNEYVTYPKTWYKDLREARRNLVRSANTYLLTFDAVNKPHWNAHLLEYRPLVGDFTKDLTKYWRYVDYVHPDYQYNSEQATVTSLSEIVNLPDDVVIFGLVDELGVLQSTYSRTGLDISLLYQRNGTIQFNDNVWNSLIGWDAPRWDKEPWDEDLAEVLEMIIMALREDLFVDRQLGYFNLVFFDMVKESLRQIPNADWVFKTTYLDISQQSNNDLQQVALYYDRKDTQIKSYVEEVKPYHSKVFNTNQGLTTEESVKTDFEEHVRMIVMSNVHGLAMSDANTETFILTDPDDSIILISDPDSPKISRSTLFEE